MSPVASRYVFKVATQDAWDAACRIGAFAGSSDDVRDGFIHLSAPRQLAGTLAKHFKGRLDLVLITHEADALGDELKWEASRDGDLFPHLYAALPVDAARDVRALKLDDRGVPIVPESVSQC
jgi:uncharacterized protein (DUF952 family)